MPQRPHLLLPEKAGGELSRRERAQVVDPLADSDVEDRYSELLTDGERGAALRGTVELGEHDPRQAERFGEYLGLMDGVAAGRRIEHQPDLMRGSGDRFADDPTHLAELLHE